MNIGLDRNKVFLVDHDPAWAEAFRVEAEFLKILLGDEVIAIDHFGSTSIPGIKAKPVIDVLVQASEMYLSAAAIQKLKAHHYDERIFDHRDEHMYPKMVEGNVASHNIHVTKIGSVFARNMLSFRDILRADVTLAKEYEALKLEIATRHPDDRQAYYKAKVDFINRVAGKYN